MENETEPTREDTGILIDDVSSYAEDSGDDDDFLFIESQVGDSSTGYCACCVKPRFWSQVEWALSGGLSAGMASALALTSATKAFLPLPVLLPIITVIGTGRTLGATLNFAATAYSAIISCIIPSVLWNLVMPRSAAAFWPGFALIAIPLHLAQSTHPGKRLALALFSVFMWIWWKGGPKDGEFTGKLTPWYFPVGFLSTITACVLCAVSCTVLPYPKTAKAKAIRLDKDMRHLAAMVFREIVATISMRAPGEHVFLDSQIHLDQLSTLLPMLQGAVQEAEIEDTVLRFISSVSCMLLVVPVFFTTPTRLVDPKPIRNLRRTIVLMREILPLLSSLATIVDNMDETNAKTHAFHQDTVKYIRKQLTHLAHYGSSVLENPEDEKLYPHLTEELTSLSSHLMKWRVNEFFKGKRPILPERGTHMKSFLYHVRRFCKELMEVKEQALEDTVAEGYTMVLVQPVKHLAQNLKGTFVHMRTATGREWAESAKTVAALVGSLALSLLAGLDPAFWAPITVAFIGSPTTAGSLNAALNRIQGTIFGSTFGYLVLRTFTDPAGWIIGLTYSLWCVLTGYVRSSPTYSYGGVVGSLTAAIIMFGYNPETGGSTLGHEDLEAMAFSRIQQTLMACVVYLTAVVMISPIRPSDTLREQMQMVLAELKEVAASVLEGYTNNNFAEADKLPERVAKIAAGCKMQSSLVEDVVSEPAVWSTGFPVEEFRFVLQDEQKLQASIRQLCSSFIDIKQYSDNTFYKHLLSIYTPILIPVAKKLGTYFSHISHPSIYPPPTINALYHQLSDSAASLVAAFHDSLIAIREDHPTRPSNILSTDLIESLHCLIEAIYSVVQGAGKLSKSLRTFRLKAHTLEMALY